MAIQKIENLNIHENPSTNTNQFDIENYLNSNFNKIKGAINNNADELEQAQTEMKNNTEDIEELQTKVVNLEAENVSLKNQIPNGESVGNPIHLSDSSNLPCEIVPIGGAEQETGDVTDEEGNVIGAMPSPDYPSEVVTVGQNVNIFDKDNVNKINAWIDNSGYFQYSSDFKVLYIQCDKNKDYVVSSKYLRGIAFLNEVPKTGLTSTNFKIQNTTELTLNSQDNTYLAVWYYATASSLTEQEILDSIKIVEGTEVGGYSPYGQGCVEIEVCNKNEFDGIMEQGNISGTTGNNVTESICIRSKNYIKIRPSESYFFEREGKLTDAVGLRFYDKDKNIISSATTTIGYGVKNKIFTTVANAYYMRFTDWTNDLTNKYLLAQSNVATDYIEHESYTKVLPTQKEFVKIGDLEDTFVKVDGKWYEAHYHPKIVFDGTENWGLVTETTDMIKVRAYVLSNPKTDNQGICNYFKVQAEATSKTNGGGISIYANNNAVYVWVPKTIASTVDELKSKLAEWNNNGAPMELYYPLATPELIECTTEQEEILNSFYTYKNVTNISMSGIGTLKVNYKKDLETLINNLLATSVAE